MRSYVAVLILLGCISGLQAQTTLNTAESISDITAGTRDPASTVSAPAPAPKAPAPSPMQRPTGRKMLATDPNATGQQVAANGGTTGASASGTSAGNSYTDSYGTNISSSKLAQSQQGGQAGSPAPGPNSPVPAPSMGSPRMAMMATTG